MQYEDRKVTIDSGIQSLDSLEAIKMMASSCAYIHKYASKSADVNLGPLSVLKENGKLNLTNMGASALMT